MLNPAKILISEIAARIRYQRQFDRKQGANCKYLVSPGRRSLSSFDQYHYPVLIALAPDLIIGRIAAPETPNP